MAGSPVPLLQSDRPPLQSLPHHPVATGQYFLLTRAEIETLGGGRDYDPGNIPHWETPWDDPLSVIATLLHISSLVMFQIELLSQSVSQPALIVILLEDLTSLELASVPQLNSLLKHNTVLR